MSSVTLTNNQWTKIVTFLRACPGVYVDQEASCRRFFEGLLRIARSGAQWRLLPKEYGHWNNIYKRFARWRTRAVLSKCISTLPMTRIWKPSFWIAPLFGLTLVRPVP